MADRQSIENIKSSLDIVQIVGEVVRLEKRGRNYFGLCPFHSEKSGSFAVNPERQICHCFGCQKGGDIFQFYQLFYRVDFHQALEELAKRAGITLEVSPGRGDFDDKMKILEVATDFYEKALYSDEGEEARKYLKSRKIPEKLWKEFRLGAHPGQPDALARYLQSKKMDMNFVAELGLTNRRNRDNYVGRLMFPIGDDRGRVRGFGARTLGSDEPKYINSPASNIFDKKKLLYGLGLAGPHIQKKDYSVICEGYLDVMALHEFGVTNAVGSMGTALNPEQVKKLKRFSTRVISLFDGDEAGLKATQRNLESFLLESMEVKVAILPGAKDPDALLHDEKLSEDERQKRLRDALKSARPALDFLIERSVLVEKDSIKRAKKISDLAQLLDRIPDSVQRAVIQRDLATRFQIPLEIIDRGGPKQTQAVPKPVSASKPNKSGFLMERELLKFLVVWGNHTAFDLASLLPYLTNTGAWSQLLRDLATKGLSSAEIAKLDWLNVIEDETLSAEIREWIVSSETALMGADCEGTWNDLVKRLRNLFFKSETSKLQERLLEAEKSRDNSRVKQILVEKQDLLNWMRSLES